MNQGIQEPATLYSPANTTSMKVALYARVSMPREGEDPRAQHPDRPTSHECSRSRRGQHGHGLGDGTLPTKQVKVREHQRHKPESQELTHVDHYMREQDVHGGPPPGAAELGPVDNRCSLRSLDALVDPELPDVVQELRVRHCREGRLLSVEEIPRQVRRVLKHQLPVDGNVTVDGIAEVALAMLEVSFKALASIRNPNCLLLNSKFQPIQRMYVNMMAMATTSNMSPRVSSPTIVMHASHGSQLRLEEVVSRTPEKG